MTVVQVGACRYCGASMVEFDMSGTPGVACGGGCVNWASFDLIWASFAFWVACEAFYDVYWYLGRSSGGIGRAVSIGRVQALYFAQPQPFNPPPLYLDKLKTDYMRQAWEYHSYPCPKCKRIPLERVGGNFTEGRFFYCPCGVSRSGPTRCDALRAWNRNAAPED